MEAATLVVHIAAGSIAIIAGYLAIFVAKGGDLHRRSGTAFVYSMIVMGLTGLVIAIVRESPGALAGGPLAAYLVVTAVTTVRPAGRRIALALLTVPLSVTAMSIWMAASANAAGHTSIGGVPIPMILFFAVVALLAALSDIRLLRGATLAGPTRIARHLWRMCFAFWIATGSFFLGQMDEFPAWLQRPNLLMVPGTLPLVLMLYWLWRVRIRRALSGLVLRQAGPLPAQLDGGTIPIMRK